MALCNCDCPDRVFSQNGLSYCLPCSSLSLSRLRKHSSVGCPRPPHLMHAPFGPFRACVVPASPGLFALKPALLTSSNPSPIMPVSSGPAEISVTGDPPSILSSLSLLPHATICGLAFVRVTVTCQISTTVCASSCFFHTIGFGNTTGIRADSGVSDLGSLRSAVLLSSILLPCTPRFDSCLGSHSPLLGCPLRSLFLSYHHCSQVCVNTRHFPSQTQEIYLLHLSSGP